MGMGVGNEKKRYKRFTNKNIRNVWEAVEQKTDKARQELLNKK